MPLLPTASCDVLTLQSCVLRNGPRPTCCLVSIGRSKNARIAACMRCSTAPSEPLQRQGARGGLACWAAQASSAADSTWRATPLQSEQMGSHWLVSWKKPHLQAAATMAAATAGAGSALPGENSCWASISGGDSSPLAAMVR